MFFTHTRYPESISCFDYWLYLGCIKNINVPLIFISLRNRGVSLLRVLSRHSDRPDSVRIEETMSFTGIPSVCQVSSVIIDLEIEYIESGTLS